MYYIARFDFSWKMTQLAFYPLEIKTRIKSTIMIKSIVL